MRRMAGAIGLWAAVGLVAVGIATSSGGAATTARTTTPVAYVVDWGGNNRCFEGSCTFIAWGTLAAIDTGNDRRLHLEGRPHFGYDQVKVGLGPIAIAPDGYVTNYETGR